MKKSTLASYIKKATGGIEGAASHGYEAGRRGEEGAHNYGKAIKRIHGVELAVDKLTREEHHGLHDGRLGEYKGGASESNVYEHQRNKN